MTPPDDSLLHFRDAGAKATQTIHELTASALDCPERRDTALAVGSQSGGRSATHPRGIVCGCALLTRLE